LAILVSVVWLHLRGDSRRRLLFSSQAGSRRVGRACLDEFDTSTRNRIVSRSGPEKMKTVPPTLGAFAAFCGIALDVRRADGSTTTFFSSFARNASRHYFSDLQRDFSTSLPVSAIATLIIPASAKSATTVFISGLEVRRVRFAGVRGGGGEAWDSYRSRLDHLNTFDARSRAENIVLRINDEEQLVEQAKYFLD
jgi:hypothetical protein